MPPSTSPTRDDEPLWIELELVRAEQADDAFAFRFARQTYLVRGPGGAYETVELPWSRELLRDLDEIRRPDRDPATVARVGDMLRELLGAAGWARHEATIVEARAARRRVHVTIRSAAAELYALPWELLTLRADGQHLGALDHVLLRYAWPGTATVAADEDEGAARLLVAWSAAGGGVPAADQVKAIQAAAKACGRDDAVEVLPRASYVAIADALDAAAASGRPFRALHLLCHGAEAGSTFGLALDGEGGEGRPAVVDAGRLQQLLAPYAHALRLVVVAACDGGNMGEPGNRIGSVAQRLHRAGLQYVIASRYPLSARGSTRMAGALHQALLGGGSVEQAFVEARAAASREVSQLDWASLQLYARPEDGDRGCVLAAAPGVAATAVASEAVVSSEPAKVATPAAGEAAKAGAGGIAKLVAIALGTAALLGLGFFVLSESREGGSTIDPHERTTTPITPQPSTTEPEPQPPTVDASEDTDTDTDTDTGTDTGTNTGETPTDGDDETGETDTGETDTGETDTGETDTGESASTTLRRKPKYIPQPKRPPGVTPTCSRGIKEQIGDELGSPGGGVYKVRVWALEGGGLTILECRECGERAASASSRASRAKVRAYSAEDVLPCKTTIDWQ